MKKTTLRQVALKLAFVAFVLLAPLGLRAQETLTVYENATSNNPYVPFEGYNADGAQHNQLIYPATELAEMDGKSITQMVFYIDQSANNGSNTAASRLGTWTVSLGETSSTTLNGLDNSTALTQVYQGYFDCSTGTLTLEFDDGYSYHGGNLLVDLNHAAASWNSWYFVGVTANGASYTRNSQRNFLPKVTFSYETPAATPKPSGLNVTDILHNQATLGWTENGTATTWQICVNDDENNLIDVTTNPYTFTGLTPLTGYTVKVRSVGTSENSLWSNPISFSTTAVAVAVGDSWSDDFEGASCDWELINGTLSNAWAWGTATNNGGTHALYVSNDGGATNAYNHSYTMIYATKLLNFADGKYEFNYDWNGSGESSYDYMRVALVPASVTLTAGTSTPSGFSSTALPTGWIALDGGGKLNLVTAWQNKSVAINVAAGNYYLVFAWRNDNGGGSNPPAAVDNVTISRFACPYDVTNLTPSNITTDGATLTWTAGEATQWQVAYSTASNFEGATEDIVSAATYDMTGLTNATIYYVRVRAYCGGNDYGSWSDPISFPTECEAMTIDQDHVFTENFDGLSVPSNYTAPTTRILPICWKAINTTTYNTYSVFPSAYYYTTTNYASSTPNCLKFYSYYSYDPQPQYAILPAMSHLDGTRIKLKARGYSASSTFKIGRMTDPSDASTFAPFEIEAGVFEQALTTTYQEFTYNIEGSGDYLAIMIDAANSSRSNNGVYIDDILVEPIPNCTEPSGLQFVSSTTNSATLSWTAGASEQQWDFYYSTENVAPTHSTEPLAHATSIPAEIEGLAASTIYYVWVRAHCSDAEQSPWIGGISFPTECDAVTTFPWSENFENYTAGNFNALCWVNELISGNGTQIFKVNTSTMGNNTTHQLQLPDMNSGTLTKLQLPLMTLPNANYQFTIDVYRSNSTYSPSDNPYEGIRVFASTDGEIEGATELAFIPRQYNEANGSIPAEAADGWYTYELPIGMSGNCYIILRGESRYCSSTYMDNFVVEPIPTCRKPKNLAATGTTAHTATLSWTNGEEGQNAWQIAYSTTSDFNPDEVTPVDVTTNPATIEGLSQSTTYYAYVRANCGNEDGMSSWCINKATFTTLAGNVTPTGLAVDNASITSSQATASWNAVASNTLHQSYDIYWDTVTVNAVPVEPAAPNLISGITATSQDITGLAAGAQYKVWVRDNCGADGLSNWSSAFTFTTASACQTPDGLAASSVTTNSATISWNTYGQTSFNLRYSDDGENWITENNVTSPHTITALTNNTPYQVQVQATCNTEAWSTTLNFTTKCDAIDVFPISYGFETTEGFPPNAYAPTTNQLGNCWRNQATVQTGNYSDRVWGTSTSNYHTGSQILLLPDKGNSSNPAKTMLVFPPMNFSSSNGYHVSFWIYRNSSSSNPEGFKVYASNTDTIDANAVEFGHYSRNYSIAYPRIESGAGWYNYDFYIPQTTLTGTVYLIFEGQSYYGNATYVDDITIEEAPSCFPVGTLTYDNVGATSAELSWSLVDDNQDTWVVEYATDVNFTDVQTVGADSHSDFVLNGLTPETHYWVRVKADCGNDDYGEVSNVIDFTTDIACAAPTDLTLVNSTTSSLTVSWTENGDATSWTVCYKAEGEENFNCDQNVTENPYTIEGLTQGTNYTVKVMTNCANGYPSPELVNTTYFQTEATCPAPTNLVVTDNSETAHGATITWNGNSENDSYTIEYAEGPMVGLTTLLNEGFEGGSMPEGWSIMGLGTSNWSVSTTDNAGGDANEMKLNWTPAFNGISRLVTPAIDLTGITEVTFSFKHNLDNYSGSHTLGIATSSDGGTTWNEGWNQSYSADASASISEVISTSDMGNSNVIFCIYYNGNSYNINDWYFDDVTITAEYNPTYSWNELAANATSPYTINTLEPETQYVVRVKGVCGSTSSPASNIVGFTTLVACPAPENFAVENSTITHNSVDLSWTVIGGTSYVVAYKADGETDFTEVENNVTSVPYTLSGLNPETPYTVKVKSNCGSEGFSAWSEEKNFTTIEACAAPTAFTQGTVTAHEATFSWTAGNGNTAWQVFVKKHADAEYPATASETVNAATATINGLDAATVYDVKIVPDCDATKLLEVANAFTTECETTVVDADNSFFEGFEGITFPPICWSVGDPAHNNDNWQRSTQYSNTGSACAYSYFYGPIYLYTPTIHIDGTPATLSFSSYNRFVSSYDKNSVLVSVNGGAWTELWSPESVSQSWVVTTIDMTAYVGQDIQLCFKYEGNNAHGWYIDDVNLYVPTVIAKTILPNKWYAISSPVHNSNLGQTVDGVTNLSEGSLYGYTEADGTWNNSITVLETGKGYIYRRGNQADITFSGFANTNDQEVAVTASCPDIDLKGFNLLGNPFDHQINYSSSFYNLDANGSWIANDNGTIGVAEGFLIHHDGSTNSVTLMAGNSKSQSVPAASTTLTFTVSNGKYTDVAYAKLDDGDALPKISHLEANAPALSIPVDGMKYAIASLGNDCESFDMTFSGKGEYTLSVDARNSGLSYVHLIDKMTGSDIDLLRQPSYHFSAGLSDLTSRFLVKLVPGDENVSDGDFAFWNGRGWTVEGEGTLQVFDALGRRILAKEVNSQLTIDRSQFPGTGVYILRLGEKTQKIVVR